MSKATAFCEEMEITTKGGCRSEDEWRRTTMMTACLVTVSAGEARAATSSIYRLHREMRNITSHMIEVNGKFGFLTDGSPSGLSQG